MDSIVKISVRNLIEFAYKSGSIDNSFRGNDIMIEGIKAHQKMQNARGEDFLSEVSLKHEMVYKEINFIISGRCDGLFFDEVYFIEEMKSTRVNLDDIDDDYSFLHWAQGKIYGYFYGVENDLENIGVKLTYYNINDKKEKSFEKKYSLIELKKFFEDTLKIYIKYARQKIKLRNKLIDSVKDLEFPFEEYRIGQREIAVSVYKSISSKNRIFINAPTGIGKTMSTIFPTLKALVYLELERFFYLTAKTITRTIAENAISILIENGLDIRCVFITAKEKICFKDETNCNKDYCEYARGYYDRVNEALYNILENEKLINRDIIEKYAMEYKICPFEFSLDISLFSEGIVCDYNYIFDPRVSFKRMNGIVENRVLLIDEAHNLVDRARDMFSTILSKEKTLAIRRKFKKEKEIYKSISKINALFLDIKKEFKENEREISIEIPDKLSYIIEKFIESAEKWLKKNKDDLRYKDFLDYYFECNSYLRISRIYDNHFTTIAKKEGKEIIIKLFCMDPSAIIKDITSQNISTVFFSATLLPHKYFRDMFGSNKMDKSLILRSPFNPKNLNIEISPISTRYRDREKTYENIANKIFEFIKRKNGNYLVFFPSYKYMEKIYNDLLFEENLIDIQVQKSGMKELEREEFLNKFLIDPPKTRVGFATLGGIFSEGIDLIGNRLSGVIIVGVGIPMVCFERELIKNFYANTSINGYDYSYTFPGMNKILQASGRLIRTENDKGDLLLIGERYLSQKYKSMFPTEWNPKIKK